MALSWALKSLSDTQTVTHRRQKPSRQRVVWGHLQQSELSCLFRTCSRAHPSRPNLQLLDSLGIELGNALVVHWLRPCHTPNAGRPGSILGQGTGSHMLQLRPSRAKVKLLSCVRLFVTPWTVGYEVPK